MHGQINMENNNQNLIINLTRDLRNKLKELQEVMCGLYNHNTTNLNNTFIFIKKNMDKVNLANRYISDIDIKSILNPEKLSDDKELLNIYTSTIKNIKELNELLNKKMYEETKKGNSSKISSFKKNLDNLRLAQNTIKAIDTSMGLTRKEWEELGEK